MSSHTTFDERTNVSMNYRVLFSTQVRFVHARVRWYLPTLGTPYCQLFASRMFPSKTWRCGLWHQKARHLLGNLENNRVWSLGGGCPFSNLFNLFSLRSLWFEAHGKVLDDCGVEHPPPEVKNAVFDIFDRDDNDIVDMIEVVCATSLLCKGSENDKVEAVFEM